MVKAKHSLKYLFHSIFQLLLFFIQRTDFSPENVGMKRVFFKTTKVCSSHNGETVGSPYVLCLAKRGW